MKMFQIYEGWRNKLLPPKELEEQINIVSAERMQICNKSDDEIMSSDLFLNPLSDEDINQII